MSALPGGCEGQFGPAIVVEKKRRYRQVDADFLARADQPAQDPAAFVQLDGRDGARELFRSQSAERSMDDDPGVHLAGARYLDVIETVRPALRPAGHPRGARFAASRTALQPDA